MKRFTFNPTISFDGVAIIIAVIAASIAWGRLSARVENMESRFQEVKLTSDEHARQLNTLSEAQATLAAIMSERNHRQ